MTRHMAIFVDQKAVVRSLRDYLAGQTVGASRDEALLNELLMCAFCIRRKGAGIGDEELDDSYASAFAEIKTAFPGIFGEADRIGLSGDGLRHVHTALAQLDFADPHRDIVGDIYEAFIGARYRGQEGQFFTPANAIRVLVEITDPCAEDQLIDPACGAGGFLLQAGLHAARNSDGRIPVIHGIDKDAYLARLARMHLALQFGRLLPVECADSLAGSANGLLPLGNGSTEGLYSLVLTNPPFGAKIVALTGAERGEYALARKWKLNKKTGSYEQTKTFASNAPPQVLFLERCLTLLRDGGRLGIVLPESLLSNPSHRHVIQYLLQRATPEAVIGMPEALFKISGKGGTHTKVCLVVLRKGRPKGSEHTFMAEAEWCGHDSRGRSIERDELPEIVERYQQYARGELNEQDRMGFTVERGQLDAQVLAPKYHDPEPRRLTGRLATSHDLLPVQTLLSTGQLSVSTGHEIGKLAYSTGEIPFVRTSDLSNWEIKVDPKHCVSEAIYDEYAARQDVREGDLLMVRDGTYLIGTAAYVTRHDERIVYQSHLYKLRLEADERLNVFLLLAILSSRPVRAQVKSMAFTQDIINSLGDRIRELILPVPRSRARRDEISSTVKSVIADRVEARELARRATLLVAGE
jgi:type I restriction enzyme M protein